VNVADALRDIEIAELQEFDARDQFASFVPMFSRDYKMGWFHRRLCRKYQRFVERVERREGPRMMVFVPPQRGKSQVVSRCGPAWVLGRHPEWNFIHASYGQSLANSFGRDVRGILNQQRYQAVFPDTRIGVYGSEEGGAEQVATLTLSEGGGYKAVGVGVGTTGAPADIFSIDDPVKDQKSAESEISPQDQIKWYLTVAQTRLSPGAGVLLTMTRWRLNDLAGMLLDIVEQTGDAWEIVCHPAIAIEDEYDDDTKELLRRAGEVLHPERHTLEEVQKVKRTFLALGRDHEWSALYQQNPVPSEGTYYLTTDFQTIPRASKARNAYITTDLALGKKTSNDWTVLMPWGVNPDDEIEALPGAVRRRMDSLETACRLLVLADEVDAQEIMLPNDHMGRTLRPFLEKLMDGAEGDDAVLVRCSDGTTQEFEIPKRYYTIEMMTVIEDKVARGRAFQARQRMGKVKWVDCPFYRDFARPELLAFPNGKKDDIADNCADIGRRLEALDKAKGPKKNKREWTRPKRWDQGKKPSTATINPLFGDDDDEPEGLFSR
jgi:hypothetical protein